MFLFWGWRLFWTIIMSYTLFMVSILCICLCVHKGAFFVPYVIFFVCCGIPVFFLETAMGQFTTEGGITCWRKICPLFEGEKIYLLSVCAQDLNNWSNYNTKTKYLHYKHCFKKCISSWWSSVPVQTPAGFSTVSHCSCESLHVRVIENRYSFEYL